MKQPSRVEKGPQSILNHWIETGYTSDAVASNGTTFKVLRQILSQGIIPPTPATTLTLPYQQKITQSGHLLYYATPIVENLQRFNPEFANQIIEHVTSQDEFNEERMLKRLAIELEAREGVAAVSSELLSRITTTEIPDELQTEVVKETSSFYAHMQSFTNDFRDRTGLTGCSVDDIIAATKSRWPKQFANFKRRHPFPSLTGKYELNPEKDKVDQALAVFDQHPEIQPTWLDSKGVIIYFDNSFLTSGKPLLGHEDESEIMIAADQPIPASSIIGIEISKKDLVKLKKMI